MIAMTRRTLKDASVISRVLASTAAVRRFGDSVVIAGALVATVAAIVAALALFVMFGRLSHRRAEAGWPTTTSRSLPASPSAGTVEADRT